MFIIGYLLKNNIKFLICLCLFINNLQSQYKNTSNADIKLSEVVKIWIDKPVENDSIYRDIPPYPGGVTPKESSCVDLVIQAFNKTICNRDMRLNILPITKCADYKKSDSRNIYNLIRYFDSGTGKRFWKNNVNGPLRKGNIVFGKNKKGTTHVGICAENDFIVHNINCGPHPKKEELHTIVRNYTYVHKYNPFRSLKNWKELKRFARTFKDLQELSKNLR